MTADNRQLIASINGQAVGTLCDEGGFWTFQYAADWLANPARYAISPKLPLQSEKIVDSGSLRPVQWFCDNLLPEETARELLARDAALDVDDAWGLLSYFGAESAGAITLLPPNHPPLAAGLRPLSEEKLQQRIDLLPRRSLSADSPKRMSLAGVQAKLAVVVKNLTIFEPMGSECSTHILKPDSKVEGYPHTAINEYFCMTLAGHVGLPVPNVSFRQTLSPIYLIERFDRRLKDDVVARIHTLDALQLLSLDRRLKYAKASADTLNDCIALCRTAAQARINLYRWTVFNILIGNHDAHMKNISFLVGANGITLAPFYDLVSTVIYTTREHDPRPPFWPDVQLTMPIGNAKFFADLTAEDVIAFGVQLGLKERVAANLLAQMVSRLNHGLAALVEGFKTFTTAGQQRVISAILALPIREMSEKLRQQKPAKPT
ncbi:MAG: type II toxin-antitoxin system HipA family toxin [Betaproteobacteria bacterium HGW-Betaproteobacteria-12]|nr:MAG: type II toxin-antitoxin system HipA family toxin [Betaproteobacteria bacterium HGW-Betaproteobacteria-12]